MKFDCTPCSFAEVVFDWVAAEARSPTFARHYRIKSSALVDRIAAGDLTDHTRLSEAEKAEIVSIFRLARGRLLRVFPLDGRWRYYRTAASAAHLADFRILRKMSPMVTLKDLSERLAADASYLPRMQAAIAAMQRAARDGATFPGRPVAVVASRAEPPILVEGYKRSIVALRAFTPSVPIYLCQPPQRVRARA